MADELAVAPDAADATALEEQPPAAVRKAEDGRMFEWCFACTHDGTDAPTPEVERLISCLEAAGGNDVSLIIKTFPEDEDTWLVMVSCPEYYLRTVAERMKFRMKVGPNEETVQLLDDIGGPRDVLENYIGTAHASFSFSAVQRWFSFSAVQRWTTEKLNMPGKLHWYRACLVMRMRRCCCAALANLIADAVTS
eukprot:SAG31_NODE_7243_length_1745_cov_1.367558_2_plen_194_part_00